MRRTLLVLAILGGGFVVHGAGPAAAAGSVRDGRIIVNFVRQLDGTGGSLPDDPLFGVQYALRNRGQQGGKPGADIDAVTGWRQAGLGSFPRRRGVKVALVDTGVDRRHPDLRGQVAACAEAISATGRSLPEARDGTCADDDGHGTIMAGIVAARADNRVGIAGVAFNARLLICRAFGRHGHGTMGDAAKCVLWARAHGARVILISAGGRRSEALADAIDVAWSDGGVEGAVVVAASGNAGTTGLSYPAALDDVVSVGATDRHDRRAPFSNHNADVEISAPGSRVLSTARHGGYALLSGTSAAAAYVAGAAALIAERHAGAAARTVRAILDGAVADRGAPGRDAAFGFGRLDLARAKLAR